MTAKNPPEWLQTAKQMRLDGKTYRQIAAILGKSETVISKTFLRYRINLEVSAALSNLCGYRPDNAKRMFIVYDSDIAQMVKDIRSGLAGEPSIVNLIREIRADSIRDDIAVDYHQGGA